MNFPRVHFSNSMSFSIFDFLRKKLRLNRGVLSVDYF